MFYSIDFLQNSITDRRITCFRNEKKKIGGHGLRFAFSAPSMPWRGVWICVCSKWHTRDQNQILSCLGRLRKNLEISAFKSKRKSLNIIYLFLLFYVMDLCNCTDNNSSKIFGLFFTVILLKRQNAYNPNGSGKQICNLAYVLGNSSVME